jgi:predicted metal-binding protein
VTIRTGSNHGLFKCRAAVNNSSAINAPSPLDGAQARGLLEGLHVGHVRHDGMLLAATACRHNIQYAFSVLMTQQDWLTGQGHISRVKTQKNM